MWPWTTFLRAVILLFFIIIILFFSFFLSRKTREAVEHGSEV